MDAVRAISHEIGFESLRITLDERINSSRPAAQEKKTSVDASPSESLSGIEPFGVEAFKALQRRIVYALPHHMQADAERVLNERRNQIVDAHNTANEDNTNEPDLVLSNLVHDITKSADTRLTLHERPNEGNKGSGFKVDTIPLPVQISIDELIKIAKELNDQLGENLYMLNRAISGGRGGNVRLQGISLPDILTEPQSFHTEPLRGGDLPIPGVTFPIDSLCPGAVMVAEWDSKTRTNDVTLRVMLPVAAEVRSDSTGGEEVKQEIERLKQQNSRVQLARSAAGKRPKKPLL